MCAHASIKFSIFNTLRFQLKKWTKRTKNCVKLCKTFGRCKQRKCSTCSFRGMTVRHQSQICFIYSVLIFSLVIFWFRTEQGQAYGGENLRRPVDPRELEDDQIRPDRGSRRACKWTLFRFSPKRHTRTFWFWAAKPNWEVLSDETEQNDTREYISLSYNCLYLWPYVSYSLIHVIDLREPLGRSRLITDILLYISYVQNKAKATILFYNIILTLSALPRHSHTTR